MCRRANRRPYYISESWLSDYQLKKAVRKLARTKDIKLAVAALEASDKRIRKAAVGRLTDQAVLAEVALRDKDKTIRKYAVGFLTDQAALAEVALHDEDKDVRKAAVGRLNDQALLAEVAKIGRGHNDPLGLVSEAAVEKITDQTLLAEVAKCADGDNTAYWTAAGKLTDQNALANVLLNSHGIMAENVRIIAADKLSPDFLQEQIIKDPESYCKEEIISSICKRYKTWFTSLSHETFGIILDNLLDGKDHFFDQVIIDSLIYAYRQGHCADIISARGGLVVHTFRTDHTDIGNSGDGHTDLAGYGETRLRDVL